MGRRDERLEQLGYPLDRLNPGGNLFDAVRLDGATIYASGHVPMDGDKLVGVVDDEDILRVVVAEEEAHA